MGQADRDTSFVQILCQETARDGIIRRFRVE